MRRLAWALFVLAGLLTACGESAPIAPSPAVPTASSNPRFGTVCAGPLDTTSTVTGVVSERTSEGNQPISGAIVELFLGEHRESDTMVEPVKETLTRIDGGYFMCLPLPIGGSGATGPGGQPFVLRVRKNGYRTASQSFRFAYSVWDYGGVEISLELVRD